jgi:hypothetical protein
MLLSERAKWYYSPEWRSFMSEVFEAGVKMNEVTQNQIFRQAALEPVVKELKALNARDEAMLQTLGLILAEMRKQESSSLSGNGHVVRSRPDSAKFAEWGRQGGLKRWQNARALEAGKVSGSLPNSVDLL